MLVLAGVLLIVVVVESMLGGCRKPCGSCPASRRCGWPVGGSSDQEADVSTSRLPTSRGRYSPPRSPQHQPREAVAPGGSRRWPMLVLAGVLLIVVVVESMQGGCRNPSGSCSSSRRWCWSRAGY